MGYKLTCKEKVINAPNTEKEYWVKSENELAIGRDDLEYHISWNWLIPVCQKWDTLFLDVSPLEYDEDKYIELCDDLDNTMTLYDIKGVYKQLVININWYNNIKNG